MLKIFDILYLNDTSLTKFTLRDRRNALEATVKPVHRRLEMHPYKEGQTTNDVEALLRKVVQDGAEGLVVETIRGRCIASMSGTMIGSKSNLSTWMSTAKNLIVLLLGGYYGSGRRGGNLSSFLCGLRVDESDVRSDADAMKFYSFFKVGGGFTAADYASVRHQTEGKWKDWDARQPPSQYIELGGGDKQYERPDVWIRPDESFVVEVKASQISQSESFRMGYTLRFPRFKRIRSDKDWQTALTVNELRQLKANVERQVQEKKFVVDDAPS